jgi:hypothetical protein
VPWCHTILAATSKYLARSNKTGVSGEATKERDPPKVAVAAVLCVLLDDEFHKTMTLQEAKSIARRHLGLTVRQVRSGAYRVNFRDGNETTAYYTDSLEDAVKTVVEMARTRGVEAVDKIVFSRHRAQS